MAVPLGGVEWYDISWQLRICRLLCHSVVPSVRSACHSVASSDTAMRQGVYSTAQGPSKRQVTPNGSVAAMAPSLPAKRNTLTRLRELVWVGGCVTALATGRHRQGDDAGVYTDWLEWPLGAVLGHLCTLLRCEDRASDGGDAGVYTNGRIGPLGAISGRLCTLLGCGAVADSRVGTQECTQIG